MDFVFFFISHPFATRKRHVELWPKELCTRPRPRQSLY